MRYDFRASRDAPFPARHTRNRYANRRGTPFYRVWVDLLDIEGMTDTDDLDDGELSSWHCHVNRIYSEIAVTL